MHLPIDVDHLHLQISHPQHLKQSDSFGNDTNIFGYMKYSPYLCEKFRCEFFRNAKTLGDI